MLKKTCTFSVLWIFLLTAMPTWGIDLKPGKYEITTKVKMPGLPIEMPPQITTQCLNEQTLIPDVGAQGCKLTDINTKDNTATYTMECNQQGMEVTSTGSIIYYKTSFEGTTQTTMGSTTGGMTVTTVIKGKHIGKCD